MTHFLARLVERARGTAPRVEPIIASRFAPPSPLEMAIEDESRETQSEPRPDAVIQSESVSTSAETADVPIEIARETLLVPQFQKEPSSLQSAESHPIAVGKVDAGTAQTRAGERARPPGARLHPPVWTPLSSSSDDEPRDQAPIIRVTIGRIDVRAAAEPPPPRKPPRPAGPNLTLDAYLRSRKEGTR